MTQLDSSKRKFIKAAAYVAPAILSLKVAPTFASGGSGRWNGNPTRPGDEPSHGGGSGPGNVDSARGGHDGSESSAFASSFSSSYTHKKKKRQWYWPFA